VSKSRAKKKQRRRARTASSAPGPTAGRRAATAPERAGARAQARAEPRAAAATRAARAPAEPTSRRSSRLDVRAGVPRPDAIWAPFPLTEIGMAAGLALFALGFVTSTPALLLAGVGVLVVVVAELCLREHFAGFRSHSILLGLLPVTAVHLGIVYAGAASWRGPLALAVDLVLAGALAWWLQRRFVAAQGGARVRGR
jgi:hypothetical protein